MNQPTNTPAHSPPLRPLQTEILVIGTGPAGASLSCFLARYGITGILISSAPGTAKTPRAHITNQGTVECLRDLGLEEICKGLGNSRETIGHVRWCQSLSGEDFARVYAFEGDPARRGEFATASPCETMDLPQSRLEPVLLKYSVDRGWRVRNDTSLVSFTQPSRPDANPNDKITVTLKDHLSGQEYTISTTYLFGADGGKSLVAKQLGLPFEHTPGGTLNTNVYFRTSDLSPRMKYRQGDLHFCVQSMVKDTPDYAWVPIVRMVKPWCEWLMVVMSRPGSEPPAQPPSLKDWERVVRDAIGGYEEEKIEVEILDVATWRVNESIAKEYSRGNVFCLGDAVHRHPPSLGLGSNTGIQDAYNLASKLHLVISGISPPSLLQTYNTERQPVGEALVHNSNASWRRAIDVLSACGILASSSAPLAQRQADFQGLKEATKEGRRRREELAKVLERQDVDYAALGTQLGQRYSGPGIYDEDEEEGYKHKGLAQMDPMLHYEPSTYPGCRLPHAWLNRIVPSEKPISTIDLAGKGAFCLITGIGGEDWISAAKKVGKRFHVVISTAGIGFGQEWEDLYGDWRRRSEVDEDGAVLVRPDRFVAWRIKRVLGSEEACVEKLGVVMASILGWKDVSKTKIVNGT